MPVVQADTDDVSGALGKLEDTPDVVVIDGAAKVERRTGRIVRVSDVALIPVQPTPLDSWGGGASLEAVRNSDTPAAFLITQQKPRTNLAAEVAAGLSEAYDLPVLNSRLSHRVAYAEAMFDGRTALDVSGAQKAKEEVHALLDELTKFIRHHAEQL